MVGLPIREAMAQSPSSYAPVVIQEDFETTMARMEAAKPAAMKRQMDLLTDIHCARQRLRVCVKGDNHGTG